MSVTAKVFKNREMLTIKVRHLGDILAFSAQLEEALDEESTGHYS